MITCLEDTVPSEPGADYHHHFVGNQCSAESNEMRFGVAGLNGCRLNLLQAIGILHGVYQHDRSLILGMIASFLCCGAVTTLTLFYRLRRP